LTACIVKCYIFSRISTLIARVLGPGWHPGPAPYLQLPLRSSSEGEFDAMDRVRHEAASNECRKEVFDQASIQSLSPRLPCVTSNGMCESEGESPRRVLTIVESTGKGKTGRVNESEPSLRLRDACRRP
jgi:hypothetical protein